MHRERSEPILDTASLTTPRRPPTQSTERADFFHRASADSLEHFSIRLTLPVSLPGLTGQSSNPGRWLLDRPVKPGDDSTEEVNLIEKSSRLVQSSIPSALSAGASLG